MDCCIVVEDEGGSVGEIDAPGSEKSDCRNRGLLNYYGNIASLAVENRLCCMKRKVM